MAVSRLKAATDLPVAVGFGVRTPEQAAAIGRIADGDFVHETGVVRRDVELAAHAGEGADNLGLSSLNDLGDLAVRLVFAALAHALGRAGADAHADFVAVKGEVGIVGRDLDGRRRGFTRFERQEHVGGASGAELEFADHGRGVGRVATFGGGDAITFDDDEFPARKQQAQFVGELPPGFFIKLEVSAETELVDGAVSGGGDGREDLIAKFHTEEGRERFRFN